MEDPAAFGRRLHHARVDRGLSQTALAAGICSPSSVSRWEDGQSVPDVDIMEQLADRLGMNPTVLTGEGFDSRLTGSAEDFADLLDTVFAPQDGIGRRDTTRPAPSATSAWIDHARSALDRADPWSSAPDPRPTVDDLSVDPLTPSTPASLETVELLDAMVRVRETPDRATVDALTDTLTWVTDAPLIFRRTAVETVVAVLLCADMPVAARAAVDRVSPPDITTTTALLLTWGGSSPGGLPPTATSRRGRDVAFGVLAHLRDAPAEVRRSTATAVVASCPDDGLVARWAGSL
ncbi:MAG TPA: helix-turn-helix domain-containing protein [Candidatus Corynebacterium avicola]|uniref:Helix-turn-helix domain-containing protein n=1 Tax=Candidatus Corynebacterium avicola TaxID=2838527 RepID=A0A9D1RRF6_9CORY|nr:helix-turn-helix domain-containing protein [Candidatus Corynebacterium avicola]